MAHEKRWDKKTEDELATIWNDRPQSQHGAETEVNGGSEEQDTVLNELAVGQSLTVLWDDVGPIYGFEDIVSCTTCGEGLTEVRLAFPDTSSRRCPTCGTPPKA